MTKLEDLDYLDIIALLVRSIRKFESCGVKDKCGKRQNVFENKYQQTRGS